jgi:S-DNA-T family DNA segregation ATPase FtsK/SpoIIIE
MPEMVPVAIAMPVPPVGAVSVTPSTATTNKRFDVTTVLLVIVVVGLVFGCILIFLLFRLRRMELQLQQTTKNFNMQTVRELIAQEIQDTVEQLEEQLILENTPELEELSLLQQHIHQKQQVHPQLHQQQQSLPFFVPLPNIQELNNMFETLVNMTDIPSHITSHHEENRIEEIVEEPDVQNVTLETKIVEETAPIQQQQFEKQVVEEVEVEEHVFEKQVLEEHVFEKQVVEVVEVEKQVVEVVEVEKQVVEVVEVEEHVFEKQVVEEQEAPTQQKQLVEEPEVDEELPTEFCLASEAPLEFNAEAGSIAESTKVPVKKVKRIPIPRGKKKKLDDISVDINDL